MDFPNPELLLGTLYDVPDFIRTPDPSIYLSDNYSVLDYETDTLEYGSAHEMENDTILCSLLNGPGHKNPGLFRYHGTAIELGKLLQADIESADYIVAHNAKFEMGWLDRGGIDIGHVLPACTMLAEFCRAGNRRFNLHLAETLERYGMQGKDPVGKLIRMGVDTRNICVGWLGDYCDIDVVRTEGLWLKQRRMMIERGLLPVFFTRNILTPVLFDIEKRGLCLDPERVARVHDFHLNKQAALKAEWDTLTDGVNRNSGPQEVQLLIGKLGAEGGGMGIKPPKDEQGKDMKTPGGDISVAEDAMKRLKPTRKVQKKVLQVLKDLREVNSAISKTITKIQECSDDTGILYASFLQANAGTHRLASKGRGYRLQLQNFPRDFRPCIRARNAGWGIGDGDAAGIEFRTAVDLAKDNQGQQDIANKVDVHANTARITLASRWMEELGPKEGSNYETRQDAKALTFKPLYGGSSGTRVQRDYFAWFRKRYSTVAAMQEGWTETVLKTKELRLASGLIFYWPGCRMSSDGKYIKYTTNIYDYPVQSLATAEMCPTATVYLWHMMRAAGMESFLINLVHDSAVGEIHPDEREQWSTYMQYCFNELIVWYLKQVYDYDWTTPLESEVNIFSHWTDSDPKGWDEQWAT